MLTEILFKFKELWTNTYESLNRVQSVVFLSQRNKVFYSMKVRTAGETEYTWGEQKNNEKLYAEIEKNDMDGACDTHGVQERCIHLW